MQFETTESANARNSSESQQAILSAAEIFSIEDRNVRRVAATTWGARASGIPELTDVLLTDQSVQGQHQLTVEACGTSLPSSKDETLARSLVQVDKMHDKNLANAIFHELKGELSKIADNPPTALQRFNELKNCQGSPE
ncbi:MAG: hypothetical protein EKK48_12575 [Candidatus Melainabacteria bacterium]|nr:MAG: hypothetical protein EKK48_12575 [Candidatus Melainabacteria bacterium]